MRTYVVGGWVRDRLLEREGRAAAAGGDRDWVVVGATPQQMLDLGYRAVGRDFPVFLHPQTGEEYALARTERKTAPGYRGFVVHAAPEVTLEEDLRRRDLTINAMAFDEQGRLIDPWHGLDDLRAGVLRHVSEAFAEDPVRILRLARFAARLPEFTIAPETLALARRMVENGEANALVPERVWQELARGLMEAHPGRMLEVLASTGLLARWDPSIEDPAALAAALERAAAAGAPLPARFAVLCAGAGGARQLEALLARLRPDAESAQLARLGQALAGELSSARSAPEMVRAMERADAWRRPPRFMQLLQARSALDPGFDAQRWGRAAQAAGGVDAGRVAALAGPDPQDIARAVREARCAAVAALPGLA